MAEHSIYTTGGTVQAEGGIYLSRQADDQLLSLCQMGKLVYILTPRQMGKSSLMVQTKERLIEVGIRSVIIDLQGSGTNATAEQWYLGLLVLIEDQLDLETDVLAWWQDRAHLGLTQRMTQFFQEVLLVEVVEPVVIFVDEIDTTLSLDFTDDFYAALRYLFVARSTDAALRRLSFVLIGVATPSDLIRDPKRTPFNIGQRLDLADFSLAEVMPLAAGLGLPESQVEQVMGWVLKWTGGHPYLTQRLCGALVESRGAETGGPVREVDVDQVVSRSFLGAMSEQDNNLQFVRDMLTKQAPNIFEVLTTYQAVRRNRFPVTDEEQSIVKSHLKLAGVVKREGKALKMRNAIYKTVFDDRWIKSHFPINWTKRLQRAAVALIGLVLFSSVPLAGFGWWQAVEAGKQRTIAEKNATIATQQREIAEQEREKAEEQRRIAQAAANKAKVEENKAKVAQKAEAKQRVIAEQLRGKAETARGFAEQRRQQAETAQQDADQQRVIALQQGQIAVQERDKATIARDQANKATEIATIARDEANKAKLAQTLSAQALALRDVFPQRSLLLAVESINPKILSKTDAGALLRRLLGDIGGSPLIGHEKTVVAVAFTPDGKRLATGSQDGTVRLWDKVNPDRPPMILPGKITEVKAIAISPDGQWLAAIGIDTQIKLWNLNNTDSPLTLTGHTASINALAFSPDSQWLATSSQDNTTKLWGMKASAPGSRQITLEGHTSSVRQVIFSSSGKWLATAEEDYKDGKSIRLWDMNSLSPGPKSIVLNGQSCSENNVLGLTFSPDEKHLAAAVSYCMQVWNLTAIHSSTEPKVMKGPGGWFNALAFSPNSQWLAAGGGSSGDLKLWDMMRPDYDDRPIVLKGHQAAVNALTFSSDSRWVFTGSRDYTARKWDLSTFSSTALLGHEAALNAIVLSPDGKWLATASEDRQTRLWNVSNPLNASISYPSGNNSGIVTVAVSPDGKWLAASDNHNIIHIWKVNAPLDPPIPLPGHQATVRHLAFSPDGQWLASGSDDRTARRWNIGTANPATNPIILKGHTSGISGMAFTPDSHKLITGSWDGDTTIRVWNLTVANPSENPTVLPGHADGIRDLVVSSDGRKMVTGGNEGLAKVWDLMNLSSPPIILRGHTSNLRSVAISPDGRWVGTSSWEPEYQARLWDLTSHDPSANPIILQFSGRLFKVDFSADGRWFAAASWDSTIQLQDMTQLTQKSVQLKGHRQRILALGFSPDSQWLATGGEDQTIRLWNPTESTAAPIILRPGTGTNDWALKFSLDSNWLVSGNWDGNVRLWPLKLEDLSSVACRTAGRNLTLEEWQQFLPGQPYRPTCPTLSIPKSPNPKDRSASQSSDHPNLLITLINRIGTFLN